MTAAYGNKDSDTAPRTLSVGGGNWIPGAGSIAQTQNAGSYSAPQFNAQGLFNSQGVYEANSGSTQLVSVPVGWGHATYEAYGQNSFLGKYAALGHVQPNNRAGVHLETTQGPSGFLGTTSNVILSGMSGSMAIATLVLEYQGNTGTASGPIDPSISRPDPLSGYERYEIPDWDGYGADAIKPDTLAAARRFLALLPRTFGDPDIAPGSDGTIGLEWAFKNRPLRKLFIDIGPGNIWHGYWRRTSGETKTLQPQAIGADTKESIEVLFKDLNA